MSDAISYDPYAMSSSAIQDPPKSLWAALRKIGPGIILAGSIVGSGELVATTSLGANHGFVFLWLILFSCVIKVFVQIELGRYAISSGKPTLGALNELPGPRFRAHWLVWWWFGMLLGTVFQLGAMCGLVGQAINLAFPQVSAWLIETLSSQQNGVASYFAAEIKARPEYPWSAFTALCAVLLLVSGGYTRIERLTTFLVAGVTLITTACVLALPWTKFPINMSDLQAGLMFSVPAAGIALAFSAFGITGVGASELYSYPYWCLEKGYARYVGPRSPDPAWAARAKGWIRVMYLDAWVSMVVFTVATVAFYLLGAAVLHPQGLVPKGQEMIAELSEMYVPVFGSWTKILFLIGAWAVLFKTLYVASASHSRLTADFLSLNRFVTYPDAESRGRWIRGFCVFFPSLAFVLYLLLGEPLVMVIVGGFAQAATLPIISGATIYLRYRGTDKRLAPSWITDALFWFACISISLVAFWALWDQAVNKLWPLVAGPETP
jgi:Mn2+/Fe2+ NRAMP family transporter